MTANPSLPGYTDPALKSALLAAGASGTVYALVMPETEAALQFTVDGCERDGLLGDPAELDRRRTEHWLDLYREPWTQKQDAMDQAYFEQWLRWSAPVVRFDAASFPFRYPTAGASEGIYKLMAEYAARSRSAGIAPEIHVFEGEYEGFVAFAAALELPLVRHRRDDWAEVPGRIPANAQFWISQPSAIDGTVWAAFEAFASALAEQCPTVGLVPDLTYVGCVAREFTVALDFPNIPAFVISQSKPFGGYYQRAGAVFSRRDSPSLFGNRWFKNLQSLAWATEMMHRHGVHELARRYRPVQEQAAASVGETLGIAELTAADVMVLGTAPAPEPQDEFPPLLRSVLRGTGKGRVLRLCLTPSMSLLIDPALAAATAQAHPDLAARTGRQ
jgi:hypothetical protein